MHESLAGVSVRKFLLVLAATGVLVTAVGAGGLLVLGMALGPDLATAHSAIIFMVAVATACIPLPLYWIIVVRARVPLAALGWQGASRRYVVMAVAVAFGYLLAGTQIYRAIGLEQALDTYLREDLSQYFGPAGADPLRLLAFLLVVGPLAAIAEELFFRGFIFGWLRRRMGAWSAAGISAAVFAAVHFHYLVPGGLLGATAAVDIFVTGLLLAWLYQTSGSLVPPIVMHAVNNITIILFVAFVL